MPETEKRVNLPVTRHGDVMNRHDRTANWAEVLIEDGRNRAVWISGLPGTPPDPPSILTSTNSGSCWTARPGGK
jgi:hypothetical protein